MGLFVLDTNQAMNRFSAGAVAVLVALFAQAANSHVQGQQAANNEKSKPAAKLKETERTIVVTAPPVRFDPFYKKYVSMDGLPLLGSEKVPDAAFGVAVEIIDHLLENRADVRKALIEAKVRVAIMAKDELTTQIPEHRDLKPAEYWDKRARGLGATPIRPASSCAEENLLGYATDGYKGECILIHEFAHTIHEMGLVRLDQSFDGRLRELHRKATRKDLWQNTYAATNHKEYWAEGVQSWFDANREADPANGVHNHVNTREELQAYDPDLAQLIQQVFGDNSWRWRSPAAQTKGQK